MGTALNPGRGSLGDTEGERQRHRGEATWRWRRRREGGGQQSRDGGLEPPGAGRGGEEPPLEPGTPRPQTSGPRGSGRTDVCGFKPPSLRSLVPAATGSDMAFV